MTLDRIVSAIPGLELAIEGDDLDERVWVTFHWPSTEQTPWTVRTLKAIPRPLAEALFTALTPAEHEHPDDAETTGPGRFLWPDGGSYANFADDAGDDYGYRFIDPDGSERGPLSSRYIRQLANELDRESSDHRDPRRPNGAILLRRIADDYDRLLAAPAERPDPMDRLYAAGFFGVEVDSTEGVTPAPVHRHLPRRRRRGRAPGRRRYAPARPRSARRSRHRHPDHLRHAGHVDAPPTRWP